MPAFPIIDTHVHLWDPQRLSYAWMKGHALLDRPYRVGDYQHATDGLEIEAMVFLECDVDRDRVLDEIDFVEAEAQRDPRIRALVAQAPLERGRSVEPLLRQMIARSPKLRGIRRILQSEADPRGLVLSENFLEGMQLLQELGLHFEITVNYTQMESVIEFVDRVPGVPMILDHCGKPGIRDRQQQRFKAHMRALAERPNIVCKLSGLVTEADPAHWTESDLRPYIDESVHAFGPDRVLFGGDWPVCLLAAPLKRWVEVLDHALADLSEADQRKIYRQNAKRFYQI